MWKWKAWKTYSRAHVLAEKKQQLAPISFLSPSLLFIYLSLFPFLFLSFPILHGKKRFSLTLTLYLFFSLSLSFLFVSFLSQSYTLSLFPLTHNLCFALTLPLSLSLSLSSPLSLFLFSFLFYLLLSNSPVTLVCLYLGKFKCLTVNIFFIKMTNCIR